MNEWVHTWNSGCLWGKWSKTLIGWNGYKRIWEAGLCDEAEQVLWESELEKRKNKVVGRKSHFKIQIFRGAVPRDKRSKGCFCKWVGKVERSEIVSMRAGCWSGSSVYNMKSLKMTADAGVKRKTVSQVSKSFERTLKTDKKRSRGNTKTHLYISSR